jgi:hypothetical protein
MMRAPSNETRLSRQQEPLRHPMDKICGIVTELGPLVGGRVDLRIGDKQLRKARCSAETHDMIMPDRDICLYVYRHLFYKPFILGMRFQDTGEKQLSPASHYRNSCLQLFVLYGFGWILGSIVVGGVLFSVLGLNPESAGGVFALAGFCVSTYLAVRLWLDYKVALAE